MKRSCIFLASRLYNRQCKSLLSSKLKQVNISGTRQRFDHPFISHEKLQEELVNYTKDDFRLIEANIKKELETSNTNLQDACHYHFDSAGKYMRPKITMLMAQACNFDHGRISPSQMEVAMIVEMIHTVSLVHDDVIDSSKMRRGKRTVQSIWGQKKAILSGNYILATASRKLARIGNVEVIQVLSQVLEDLVAGEFMQLGSKEDESERFNHYLSKTYKKTASLIANSCKAVAILSDSPFDLREPAFQYGKNAGIAFQLIDDYLDFTGEESSMGKPVCADLELGLATAPVLYASMQFPELSALIMRRFSEAGDVERAKKLVEASDGVRQCYALAVQHCKEAVKHLRIADQRKDFSNGRDGYNSGGVPMRGGEDFNERGFEPSAARNSLIRITQDIINRNR